MANEVNNVHVKPQKNEWGNNKWCWVHVSSGVSEKSPFLSHMVLSLIKHYAANKPCKNLDELRADFPDSIRPGYGVVQSPQSSVVQKYRRQEIKYFLEEEEQIKFPNGSPGIVCTQWGASGIEKPNFDAFVKRAQEFGYEF